MRHTNHIEHAYIHIYITDYIHMPRGVCVLIYMQIAFTRKKLIIEKIARTPEVVTHSNELPACILYPP